MKVKNSQLQKLFYLAVKKQFAMNPKDITNYNPEALPIAEDFFWEGVQAVIHLLTEQYESTTGLILKQQITAKTDTSNKSAGE